MDCLPLEPGLADHFFYLRFQQLRPRPPRASPSILYPPPNGALSLLLPSNPLCQSPGSSPSIPTPPKLALRFPGGPLPFPSLSQITPLGTGRIGLLPALALFFSGPPRFAGPRLPYTPASPPISVPSTCHSPAPTAAERTQTRVAHLCAAFRARARCWEGDSRSGPGAAAEPPTSPQLGATAGAGPTPEAVPRGPGHRPGAGEGQAGAGPRGRGRGLGAEAAKKGRRWEEVGDEAEVTPRVRPPVRPVGGSHLRRAEASANGRAQTQRRSGGSAFAGS